MTGSDGFKKICFAYIKRVDKPVKPVTLVTFEGWRGESDGSDGFCRSFIYAQMCFLKPVTTVTSDLRLRATPRRPTR